MVSAFVQFGSSSDFTLQVVMSKIVLSMVEAKEHRFDGVECEKQRNMTCSTDIHINRKTNHTWLV